MAEIEPPSLVTVEDLSDWIGEPITEEIDKKRATLVIGYAFTLINTEIERDNDYWRSLDKIPEAIKHVALQLAGRGYLNPESWGNESVDDWRAGGRPIEELGMYLTPTEKRMISRYAPTKLLGIGVLDTYRDEPHEMGPRPWFDPITGGIPDWRS